MKKYHPLFLSVFLLPVILFFAGSCKKKQDEPQEKKTILTINFSGKYLNPIFTAVIFVSDLQGNVIADTTFKGDGLLTVEVPEQTVVPGKIMVTIVAPEMGAHRVNVYLTTYLYPTATTWNLSGSRPDTVGHATITLTNLPALTGPVLYSSSGFYNFTSSVTSKNLLLYKSPDDLFIKLTTSSGTKVKWVPGIETGKQYNIDVSDAEDVAGQTIGLPGPAVSYEARISGYTGAGFDSPIPYTAAIEIGGSAPVTEIPVSVPPQPFTGFHTDIRIAETWESPATYCYRTDGAVPSAFKKINASVTSVEPATASVRIGKTGENELTVAYWMYSGTPEQPDFRWRIFGPDTVSLFTIPKLSPQFKKLYPELIRDSLVFQSVSLLHFIQPITYDGFLEKLLVSGEPDAEQRIETSSVIWLPLQSKK